MFALFVRTDQVQASIQTNLEPPGPLSHRQLTLLPPLPELDIPNSKMSTPASNSATPLVTFTTTLIPPPGPSATITVPTRTIPAPTTNPPALNDAFAVRLEVFVDEQKCPPEIEIDEDDARCWHWVIYNTTPATPAPSTEKVPIAVVRLVPPPHPPHGDFIAAHGEEALAQAQSAGPSGDTLNANGADTGAGPGWDLSHEPYIKFGRVAVVQPYRGFGLGRRLMETAMEWAAGNAAAINRAFVEAVERDVGPDAARSLPEWKGLALVHGQVQVEKMYERLGFVTDQSLGRWIEDGIEHVGMWKRLDVKG
ncbi:acyl-CoA N-acyltransferase [Aspergillus egyptiacus]|nr:acyl-CoA N-acyltransferase [Aspergillus egyptiacus]